MKLYLYEVTDHHGEARWIKVERHPTDSVAVAHGKKYTTSFLNVLWFKHIRVRDVTNQAENDIRLVAIVEIDVKVSGKVKIWSEGDAKEIPAE